MKFFRLVSSRALEQHENERHNVWVIDATNVIKIQGFSRNPTLSGAGPLHPVANASLFDIDGHRVTAFLSNAPRYNFALLNARNRAWGRCANRIKTLECNEMGKLPCFGISANQLWTDFAVLAMNLVAWMQLASLPTGPEAAVWDMKRWRYRLFSIAGKIFSSARQKRLLIPDAATESQLLIMLSTEPPGCTCAGGKGIARHSH